MNLQVQICSKLSALLFFVLLMMCRHAHAFKEMAENHLEVVRNQTKLLDSGGVGLQPLDGGQSSGRILDDDDDEHKQNNSGEATTNGTSEDKISRPFWSGVIDSLSMIFFVEFGDRVRRLGRYLFR